MSLYFLHFYIVDMPEDKATLDLDNQKISSLNLWRKNKQTNNLQSETARVKQGEDYILFCLDGVGRSHVVTGDISTLSCRQGTGEPPVPFSVRQRHRPRAQWSAINRQQRQTLHFSWFNYQWFIYSQLKKHPTLYLMLEEYCFYIF